MLEDVSIGQAVRFAFDPKYPLEATVAGVERDDDGKPLSALLVGPRIVGGSLCLDFASLASAELTDPPAEQPPLAA